ncbi:MAG: carboxypeptidase regulatory-like domain-containing protein [Terracidiphilus sp.]
MIGTTRHLRALFLGASMSFGLVTVVLTPHVAIAQADLGSISGTVTDASGAVVSKAVVTVTNNGTGAQRNSVTNSKGEYSVTQLLPADYTVSISAPGFATAMQGVSVSVGSTNNLSAKLAVAGGQTQVIVAADDFASVQLEKPEVSTVIETDQILSLPTLDRNPYNLVAFSGNLSADPTATSRGVGFNISGARSTSVDILLDGAENTDLYAVGIGQTVPMDATSEIRIVTSNSGAEYGRGSGAVNVATKSGSNAFHGSTYEFNRISTLASDGYNNNYLHDMYGSPAKPRYTHNQFGYSIGGPVKKDKLFFFSSTEWTRIRSAQNVVATVPTPDLIAMSAPNMQAYFAAYGKLNTPINGQTFTGSSQAVQNVFGTDINGTSTTPGLAASNPAILTTPLFGQDIYQVPADSGGGLPVNQWISFNRADWTISQNTSMFVRYIQESAVNPAGTLNNSPYAGYNTGQTQFNHNLEVSLSHAFTPTLASGTKLLGTRYNNAQPLGTAPVGPTLYVNGSVPETLGGGYINFPGYAATTPGNTIPFGGPQNFIQIGEDLAWSKGKHQITFGGNFLFVKDNRTFGAYEESIDGLVQSGTPGALQNFIGGGLSMLQVAINPNGAYPCYRDVDSGVPVSTSACQVTLPVTKPNFSRSNRYQDGAAYVSDAYKVSPQLTLNYGVRWEIYGVQHSQRPGYDANFFLGSGSDIWDQIRNGQVLTRNNAPDGRLWNLNKKQYGPKVGFAYDPIGNGKTSIRGGFGLSYERNFNNATFNVIQNPPNYGVVSLSAADNGGQNIPISANNYPASLLGTGTIEMPSVTLRAVDPKIKPAYSANYSLSVERQIDSATVSLSYVGTRGIHNYSIANINRNYSGSTYLGDPLNSSVTGDALASRTNLQYSNINWRSADGDSYYQGATAEIRSANLAHTGLNVRGDYTWSHSTDNTSSTFTDGGSNNDNLGYTDPFNKALDYGPSDFDQRQRVAAALIWEVPFGSHLTGTARRVADNWTISTTFNAQTGTPFTIFDCSNALTVCPRASFVEPQSKTKTRNMTDISSIYGANTYSYMSLPQFWDVNNNIIAANYNEQINPNTGTSDTPICSGLYGAGCHFVTGMTGRNAFQGPGSWNQNLGIVKDVKLHDRYDLQFKGEFINVFNHANTFLNLGGTNDVSQYTDVLAFKGANSTGSIPGNRNTELSVHFAF